jgi:hypothetical protein
MSNNIVKFSNVNDQLDHGGVWNPLLATPIGWYDANDADTITLNGNDVTQWDDKSGNNYHLEQTNGSKRPRWGAGAMVNGMNVMHYEGNQDHVFIDSISVDLTQFCMLSVAVSIASGDWPATATIRSTDSSDFLDARLQGGPTNGKINHTFKIDNVSTPITSSNSTELADDNPFVLATWYDGFDATARANGGSTSKTVDPADGATFTVNYIKCGWQSNTPRNYHAEMILIPTADITTIEKCEGYLAWKWGLQGSLESSHPYKNLIP